MTAVFVLLGILVVLGAALVLLGRLDSAARDDPTESRTFPPPGGWTPESIGGLRFRVGLRGYRMDEVDAALESLASELRDRTPDT